jgi:hypothetical protein
LAKSVISGNKKPPPFKFSLRIWSLSAIVLF